MQFNVGNQSGAPMPLRPIIIISIASTLVLSACGGIGDGSICDQASRHLAVCTGRPGPSAPAVCAGDEANLAGVLLGLSCEGIQAVADDVYGKADGNGCLAPWDCPEEYPAMDQACGAIDKIKCQGYCEDFYADPYMRLKSVTCEVLANNTAHCQCKGYWLPWKESQSDPEPNPEDPKPEDPKPEDPPPFDPDQGDFWP
jgi:hypothetical protein